MRKVVFFLVCILIYSCNNREEVVDKSKLLGNDYRLFQNTPAWELAKAVEDEDESKINEILAKNKELINYQESKFGSNLLLLTIRNQQYNPFKILLEYKPNLEIHNSYDGSSAIIEACEYKAYDIKFVELLIKKGANVNDAQVDIGKEGKTKTPLMVAVKTGKLNLVELLVKSGADINYQNEYGQSALSESIMVNRYNTAYFLLQKGADYKRPIFYRPDYSIPVEKQDLNDKGKPMYITDVLQEAPSDYDNDKYKLSIIDFLKSKGVIYR
jgi:ankyrin repeat protein